MTLNRAQHTLGGNNNGTQGPLFLYTEAQQVVHYKERAAYHSLLGYYRECWEAGWAISASITFTKVKIM